jgi:hypothetical protein
MRYLKKKLIYQLTLPTSLLVVISIQHYAEVELGFAGQALEKESMLINVNHMCPICKLYKS